MMTKMFTYRNYNAEVEYSTEDKVYYGKISGIDDLVSFEGDTPEKLETAFREAVDDYVETCQELHK